MSAPLEVWMRGPIDGVPALLQPAAHAVLQVQEELHELLKDFSDDLLWEKPHGVASVGFHLQHLAGVLDRLQTYAEGNTLSAEQFDLLSLEKVAPQENQTVATFLARFDLQVEKYISYLKQLSEADLLQPRGIGRKQIPTNIIGLIFHAAEHTTRHFGQLYVTAKQLV